MKALGKKNYQSEKKKKLKPLKEYITEKINWSTKLIK